MDEICIFAPQHFNRSSKEDTKTMIIMMKKFTSLMMALLFCASFSIQAQSEAQSQAQTQTETQPTFKLFAKTNAASKVDSKPWRSIAFSSNVVESTLTFSNGKQYGKHFFLGYGMGVDYFIPMTITLDDPNNMVTFPNGATSLEVGGLSVLPLFFDGRMRIFNSWISPAVRLRTGFTTNISHPSLGGFILPEIALDLTRYVSVSMGWAGQAHYRFDIKDWVRHNTHPYFGLAVNF